MAGADALHRQWGIARQQQLGRELEIRPFAIGRNNWLFAVALRAGKRAAAVMSLVQSARLNGHDPYLKDVPDGCLRRSRPAPSKSCCRTAGRPSSRLPTPGSRQDGITARLQRIAQAVACTKRAYPLDHFSGWVVSKGIPPPSEAEVGRQFAVEGRASRGDIDRRRLTHDLAKSRERCRSDEAQPDPKRVASQ